MKDYLSAIEIFHKENYADKEKLGAVGTRFGASSFYVGRNSMKKNLKSLWVMQEYLIMK